jgi:hypothetical protein
MTAREAKGLDGYVGGARSSAALASLAVFYGVFARHRNDFGHYK